MPIIKRHIEVGSGGFFLYVSLSIQVDTSAEYVVYGPPSGGPEKPVVGLRKTERADICIDTEERYIAGLEQLLEDHGFFSMRQRIGEGCGVLTIVAAVGSDGRRNHVTIMPLVEDRVLRFLEKLQDQLERVCK